MLVQNVSDRAVIEMWGTDLKRLARACHLVAGMGDGSEGYEDLEMALTLAALVCETNTGETEAAHAAMQRAIREGRTCVSTGDRATPTPPKSDSTAEGPDDRPLSHSRGDIDATA